MCTRIALTKAAVPTNLTEMINGIMETYVANGSEEVFQTYKAQTINNVIKQAEPAKSMKVLHQIELGLIDALMEHAIDTGKFE